MKVEFVDLAAQYKEIREEVDAVIADVINTSAFIGGRYVKEFERRFAEYAGAKFCVGVANGTDAIYLALRSLGVGAGDEVITAANSFIATSEAISQTGAKVVFVDCDKETYNIDVSKIEAVITGRAKAIIPVHLYGRPADMGAILKIASARGVAVVQDAAQAHGAEVGGVKIGAIGDCACYSFYPGKNLGAYGDGGAVVTNDEKFALHLRMLANHGRKDKYDHEFEGVNSRLDGLQAAVLGVKLGRLDGWNERRRKIAEYYTRELDGVVVTPRVDEGVKNVYHLYVARVENRTQIAGELKERGVSTGVHYPIPLPFLNAYKYLGHRPEDFPVSHEYKDRLLSLPIHGSMTDGQVEYVVEALKGALKKFPAV